MDIELLESLNGAKTISPTFKKLIVVVSVPPHAVRTYIVSHDTVINMFYPTWSVLTKDRTLATRTADYEKKI